MVEIIKRVLVSQFGASLSMLNECVERCAEEHWKGHVGNHAFWHVAYHALFFTDLYLSRGEQSFVAPSFYREDYHFLGQNPLRPDETVIAEIPYDKDVILEYVEICRRKASEIIESETRESLEGPCGFSWYKVPRVELYLNNIRHVQHHGAQMGLYLRRSAGIGIDWVSSG